MQECVIGLGVEIVSVIGNTVRLSATFRDFDGELVDPGQVVVKVWDGRKSVIEEGFAKREGEGFYTYLYTVPDTNTVKGPITYGFSGELGDKPIKNRATLSRNWEG